MCGGRVFLRPLSALNWDGVRALSKCEYVEGLTNYAIDRFGSINRTKKWQHVASKFWNNSSAELWITLSTHDNHSLTHSSTTHAIDHDPLSMKHITWYEILWLAFRESKFRTEPNCVARWHEYKEKQNRIDYL